MSSECRTCSEETGEMPGAEDVDPTTARYLYAISKHSAKTDERVETGQLREELDVTPASVSEMSVKLDERGLVDYQKYEGVVLTERGEGVAAGAAWRLCIVATFFESVLDAPVEEATAVEIGCALPQKGLYRLRERIDTACLDRCPESTGTLSLA